MVIFLDPMADHHISYQKLYGIHIQYFIEGLDEKEHSLKVNGSGD